MDGQYLLNPTLSQLKDSQLNLVVAGTQGAVLMVESEARELSEDVMLGAVVFGHDQMQTAINAINELVEVAGKPEWNWQAPAKDEALIAKISEIAEKPSCAMPIASRRKQARMAKVDEIRGKLVESITAATTTRPRPTTSRISSSISKRRSCVARS